MKISPSKIIEQSGFKWNGVVHTCGFYRINHSAANSAYYLEKFKWYKNKRAVYQNIHSLYYLDNRFSWTDYEVNESDFTIFKNKMLNAVRDTKIKRLQGYFKQSEEHYSHLHCKNL